MASLVYFAIMAVDMQLVVTIWLHRTFCTSKKPVIGLFHWSRPVGNYVFFERRDQCLQGWLGPVVVSRHVWESR